MKLRIEITFDADANNFKEAAAHEIAIGQLVKKIKAAYPGVTYSIKQTNPRTKREGTTNKSRIRSTGNLNKYED